MDLAVKGLRHHAADFITEPINVEVLDIALQRTRERIVMQRQLQTYTTHLESLIREKSVLQCHLSSLGLMIGSISHGIKRLLTGLDGGMYLLEKGFKSADHDIVDEGWQTVKLMVGRIRKLILMNLLENAVDACRDAETQVRRRIGFSVEMDKGDVVFTVSDNGAGMDDQTLDKLFTFFFTGKGRKGTGLGLFITKNIVDQHGGDIQVSSSPGRGSRFKVRLPGSVKRVSVS